MSCDELPPPPQFWSWGKASLRKSRFREIGKIHHQRPQIMGNPNCATPCLTAEPTHYNEMIPFPSSVVSYHTSRRGRGHIHGASFLDVVLGEKEGADVVLGRNNEEGEADVLLGEKENADDVGTKRGNDPGKIYLKDGGAHLKFGTETDEKNRYLLLSMALLLLMGGDE
eukprot:g3174.t1